MTLNAPRFERVFPPRLGACLLLDGGVGTGLHRDMTGGEGGEEHRERGIEVAKPGHTVQCRVQEKAW